MKSTVLSSKQAQAVFLALRAHQRGAALPELIAVGVAFDDGAAATR